MSVSFSSPTNDSFPSSDSSIFHSSCADFIILFYMITASTLTNVVFVLPLSVFVLYLGFQRWKQQRSSAAVLSHSDFFTYNMAVMELIGILGSAIACVSLFTGVHEILTVGILIEGFPWNAQMFLPILICLERYLAVVHPITYRKLKQGAGVRIRYISTVCIWLQCSVGLGFVIMSKTFHQLYNAPLILMAFSLFIVTFCSLSILCVLIRPRPGEVGGDRVRVDQLKRKAFQTVIIIMGVLLVRFGGNLFSFLANVSTGYSLNAFCVLIASLPWFNLPSSLVLPLLFLHRAGKLPGCNHSTG